jgi:ubiquinone/menaquinone biosynthesis C-methylase UbiE
MNQFERSYYEAEEFWADDALAGEHETHRYEESIRLIPPATRSLVDVGCGNGRFGALLSSLMPEVRVTSVDRSSTALSYVSTDKVQADASEIPLRDLSADCVSCLEVIEHLPIDAFENVLSELCRVAAQSVIVSVPYREDVEANSTQCPKCRSTFNVDLHLRTFDDDVLSNLLALHGFSLDAVSYAPSSTRLFLFASAWEQIMALKQRTPTFRSPICPVCGYKKPSPSLLHEGQASAPNDGARPLSAPPGWISRAGHRLRRVWPTYERSGYWVAARYVRR